MKQELDYIIGKSSVTQPSAKGSVKFLEHYSELLEKYKLEYTSTDYYLEVGKPEWIQGWIIDISVVPIQIQSMMETILPFLIYERLAFKIARNAKQARAILGGEFGYTMLGKLMSIYLPEGHRALSLTMQLIELTQAFKGPEILTDRHLAGVVFTRYGAVNPIIMLNEMGIEEQYIYNQKGELIRDPYSIPFELPEGINWPFFSICSAKVPKKETVLQDKYKPMEVLKEDAKGSVKKGLYLEKLWRIRWCVIKEGRRCMIGDSKGRDAKDRLRWQYELQEDLQGIVPLPKVYDFFEENGDAYLVMEYIKGKPLQKIVGDILHGITWSQLSLTDRLQIMDYMGQVLNIIGIMHERGYIHRDITSGNFLVNKKQELWMIDLEISYSEKLTRPNPPFRLGTPGFMSPEQQDTKTPTVQQDIYAIGALFINLMTGFMPAKFALESPIELAEQLSFFIPDIELITLLAACLSEVVAERPGIKSLKEGLNSFREKQIAEIKSKNSALLSHSPTREKLKNVINSALPGLVSPVFLNRDKLWLSKVGQQENFNYEQDSSFCVSADFYQGLSGVIWLLAKAYKIGFSIDSCMETYSKSETLILDKFMQGIDGIPAGLYFGTAGMALALAEGIDAGIIKYNDNFLRNILSNFEHKNSSDCGMANGLAGQGMALLSMTSIFDELFIKSFLLQKLDQLISQQQADGSWITIKDKRNKLIKATGFADGTAGITCFLLKYIQIYPNEPAPRRAAVKALEWICSKAYKKRGYTRWPLHSETNASSPQFQEGCAGVILCLIKAYEVFRNPVHQTIAEDCLRNYSTHVISVDITQANGAAGLGEIFLEGSRIFQSAQWQTRADAIAQFILHHFIRLKDGSCYWMPNGSPFNTAGLMEGNSGIIHFLLHYYAPETINHPLLASTIDKYIKPSI